MKKVKKKELKNSFFFLCRQNTCIPILYPIFSIVPKKALEILHEKDINNTIIQTQQDVSSSVPRIMKYHSKNVYQYTIYTSVTNAKEIVSSLQNCSMTKWNPNAFDIIPSSGGKSTGILKVLEHFQIKPDEFMAFGDGENDIKMLKLDHVGIAMGNADDIVKKNANYITDHIDEDGIYNALQHYHLI